MVWVKFEDQDVCLLPEVAKALGHRAGKRLDEAEFLEVIEVNLKHVTRVCKAAIAKLEGEMMDTMIGFLRGEANRGKELMVFDWDKAARLIVDRKAQSASAGLADDWEYTGGDILADGMPVPQENTYVYLASTWSTPEVWIDGETLDCFRMQSETPGWDSGTYWPESARAILGETK